MDSAVCLPFGPLPTLPLHFHINKGTTTRVLLSKPHFTFNPSQSSSFPNNGSGFRRQQRQTFSNVVFAMDRLSKPATKENKGGNHEIVRGTVGASLVLACAVAMMGCSGKLRPRAFANCPPTPPELADSPELANSLLTSKGALNSLLDTTVKLASPNVKPIRVSKMLDEVIRPDKVPRPSQKDVADLKMEAVKLMKAGKGEDAAAKLRKLYEQVKDDPEPKHFVEMALVEILMAQEKYKEAYKTLGLDSKPKEDYEISDARPYEISDARRYLYKAILCTMNDDVKAKKYWKIFTGEYQDDQSEGHNPKKNDDRSGGLNPKNNDDQSGGFPFSFRF